MKYYHLVLLLLIRGDKMKSFKNIKDKLIQHPYKMGTKTGAGIGAITGAELALKELLPICNSPEEAVLTSLLTGIYAFLGYIGGIVVPGVPIGAGIDIATKKQRPKKTALVKEIHTGYIIDEKMPVDIKKDYAGLPVTNEKEFGDTQIVYKSEHNHQVIYAQEIVHGDTGKHARTIQTMDICDSEQEPRVKCLEHLTKEFDLKGRETYIQKLGNDPIWEKYTQT